MLMENMQKMAVLLTCHNRREKTLQCLDSLFNARCPKNCFLDVYLVDDGSTDGTGGAVINRFPQVKVVHGSGNLFWNKGMRLAWDTAAKNFEYDFYLLLNDDTMLTKFAITELLQCSDEALQKDNKPAIIVGACQSFPDSNKFSYGGWIGNVPVIPNGEIQFCNFINGNITIVPKGIYAELGNLSSDYTHAIGDSDYGLRAIRSGFSCYTTRNYIATCPPHENLPTWCNPERSLAERWKSLHSPLGLNIKEQNDFRRKFWGWKWVIFALKVYFKTLCPRFYSVIIKKHQPFF